MNNRRPKKRPLFVSGGYFDYQTLFLLFVIVSFGVLMVYSASSYRARVSGLESSYFAKRQALFAVVGFVLMMIVSHIDYKKYKNISLSFLWVCVGLLALVLLIGKSTNGSSRWLPLGPLSFQPSELAKVAIIIYMAHACSIKQKHLTNIIDIGKVSGPALLCIIAIAIENLSTAIVCFAILVAIIFVASPTWKWLIWILCLGAAGGAIFVKLASYRSARFDAWLHPETSENGYQTLQSMYAVGSGKLFGRGLGQSIQKAGFLPESHNDMIFAVICEELGLFGAVCVIALFVVLIFRFKFIADNTVDSFGGLIVTGITTHVAVQLAVNVGVVVNLIPNTGVTLPFISYGGSSLVFMLAEIGIILGISRQIKPLEKR